MAIFGISGKKQSGKDTIAQIIQNLTIPERPKGSRELLISPWRNVKFSDKLKEMVCLLINCTIEDLESEKFKNTPLGEEWKRYYFTRGGNKNFSLSHNEFSWVNDKYFNSYEEAKDMFYQIMLLLEDHSPDWWKIENEILTPRKLLQLLGTECGRQIIHPNIWVNSTMVDYKLYRNTSIKLIKYPTTENEAWLEMYPTNHIYPNWIISDVRFPNEVKAIKKKNGILIRVERESINTEDQHESETALDNYNDWDYIIQNNGTIEELTFKINEILIKEKYV